MPDYKEMDKLQKDLSPICRRKAMEWLIKVHQDYTMVPETLYLCFNLMDRVLCKTKVTSDKIMLLALTVVFIASKYQEIYPPDLYDFLEASPQYYEPEEILAYEIAVLKLLDYEALIVSPYLFLERYIDIIDTHNKQLFFLAQFILEFSLFNKNFCKYANSLKAASCLYAAFKILKCEEPTDDYWDTYFRYFTGYGEKDLKSVLKMITNYLAAENEDSFEVLNIYEKFSKEPFEKVAPFLKDFLKVLIAKKKDKGGKGKK